MAMIIIAAALSVCAALITLSRLIGWGRLIKYGIIVDVAFTVLLGVLLHGTLTGMLVAIVGGLLMALTMWVLKTAASIPRYSDESMSTAWDDLFSNLRKAWSQRYEQNLRAYADEYDDEGKWVYNDPAYMRDVVVGRGARREPTFGHPLVGTTKAPEGLS